MTTTRATLLARVRSRSDRSAWNEFHRLYAPLMYRYARSRGLSRVDAEEVRDQCLEVITRKLPDFEYDRARGGFKNWLFRIVSHKVVDLLRKKRETPADSADLRALRDEQPIPEALWDRHWRYEHLKYCLADVRDDVSDVQYRAFHMLLFDGYSTVDVQAALDLNANQVYKAKSRILQRIRERLTELGLADEV